MQHTRPDWTGGQNMPPPAPQGVPQFKSVNIDVHAFVRTRDALTGAFFQLNTAIDHALRAYADHTRVVLNGDAALDVSFLAQPIGLMQQPQQMMAQMALGQNGGIAPQAIAPMLQNGQPDVPPMEEEGDGKKKRKKRAYKPRDPNAPKRPLTAYFRYLGEMRPIIQKEMTDSPGKFENSGKPGDISRIATDRWNLLTPEQQQPYKAAYQAELKNYEAAIAAYKLAGGVVDETAADESNLATDAGAQAPVVVAAPDPPAKAVKEDSSDSDSSDEEAPAKPAAPPAATPKKSAMKKGQKAAPIPTPVFNTVNDAAASEQLQAESAKSSSPAKKRKSAETTESEGGKKKRSRKAKSDEAPATSDPAPPASSPPVETSGKKKKEKKSKKKD